MQITFAPFGKFGSFVELSACMTGILGFRPVVGDTIYIVPSQDSDGKVAVEIVEDSLNRAGPDQWFTLQYTRGGEVEITVYDYDLIEDASRMIEEEWQYRNSPLTVDFGENEIPQEHRVYTRGDEFTVSEIDWVDKDGMLPSDVTVRLPDWLVCAEEDAPDSDWNREINDQLQAKFGVRARWFTFARAL